MEKKTGAKHKAIKILNIVAMVFLALCVGLVVYTTISFSKNGIVNYFGYSFHVIQTESMEPEIKVGDLVIVKSVPYDEINIGDDILFKCEDTTSPVYGRYIVHRVIEFTETEGVYITKGINSPGKDKVPSKAEGKAISVNSWLGSVFSFLTSWRSVLIIIAILGLIVFTIFQVFAVVSNAEKYKAAKNKEKLENDAELKEKLKNELLEEIKQENNTGNKAEPAKASDENQQLKVENVEHDKDENSGNKDTTDEDRGEN